MDRMKDQRTSYGTEDKLLRYNRFMFRYELPYFREKTGPTHLALVGFTAGWQMKCGWKSRFLKFSIGQTIRIFVMFNINANLL